MTKDIKTDEEVFDEAFGEATAEDDDDFVALTKEEEEIAEKEAKAKEEADAKAQEELEIKAKAEADKVVEKKDQDEDVIIELTADEKAAETQAEIEKLQHKMSSWEGRIKKANERAKTAEDKLAVLEDPTTVAEKDTSPSEEDTILAEFKDEFPDLVKPLEIMAKKHAKIIADERLGEVTPTLEKIQEAQQLTAQEQFLAPIHEAHPDWKTFHESGQLQEWIDTKPSLQKRVLSEVVINGTQAEIIEMFDTYKKEKNIKTQTPANTDKVDSELKDILAVPGKTAGPKADKPDMSDFDAAWKEANQ